LKLTKQLRDQINRRR